MTVGFEEVLQNVCVKAPFTAKSKDDAIDQLCLLIADRSNLSKQASELARVVKLKDRQAGAHDREGVVCPHADSPLLDRPVLAIGRCASPIQWDTNSAHRITCVCLLIVPFGQPVDVALQMAMILNNKAIKDRFYRCETEADFQDFFRRVGRNLDVPEGFVLKHHLPSQPSAIQAMAWSRDGKMLAFASEYHTHAVLVWAEDGNGLSELSGHGSYVWDLAWSPSHDWIASGSLDETVRIWAVDGTALQRTIRVEAKAHGVAWAADGQAVAVARHIGGVRIWSAETGERQAALDGSNVEPAYRVAWSPDGELLVGTGGRGLAAVLWNARTKRAMQRLEAGQPPLVAIAWSRDSAWLAIGDSTGKIRVWEREKWDSPVATWKAHEGMVTSLSFSCDSDYLASKGDDGNVVIWTTSDWEEVACLLDPTSGRMWDPIAFHPGKLVLATLGGVVDYSIRVWQLRKEELARAKARRREVSLQAGRILLPPALVEATANRTAVLFAGAGMSAHSLGLETGRLKEALADVIKKHYSAYDGNALPFEIVADEYDAIFGKEALASKIASVVGQDSVDSAPHRIAVNLFDIVVTTNWDLLFERAYHGRSVRVVSANEDCGSFDPVSANIIKMHGSVERPMSLVAAVSDYETYHLSHGELLALVGRILSERTVVFVGYSLRDEHLRRMLATVRYGDRAWAKRAFAVGRFDEVQSQVLRKRGVEPLNCDVGFFFPELERAVGRARELGGRLT